MFVLFGDEVKMLFIENGKVDICVFGFSNGGGGG